MAGEAADARGGSARRLDDDLWLIDTLAQGQPGWIACYLLAGDDGLALVDTGPASTVEAVLAGIRAAGLDPGRVRQLVLTHVHLDHAGAAGTLARLLPAAQVYVHPRGAPHLVDPSRLLASAARIYGERMGPLWGHTEPVPAERVVVLADGEGLRIGRRALSALHTPGHAVHHIAFHDVERRVLFAGDAAGVRLEGLAFVRPPTPPPDLSLEDWSATIARLRGLGLEAMYLPHFGVARNVEAHLNELEGRLYRWGDLILAGMRAGKQTEELVRELMDEADPMEGAEAGAEAGAVRRRYELASNYAMSVRGYERYYRKREAGAAGG